MIIFDLDCLADSSHREHFIVAPWDLCTDCYELLMAQAKNPIINDGPIQCSCGRFPLDWIEDRKAYDEAIIYDEPIKSIIDMLEYIGEAKEYGSDTPWVDYGGIVIWSSREETTREKTEEWLRKRQRYKPPNIKMRPIRDMRSQEVLFEDWIQVAGYAIEFVFSSHKPTIDMFRKKGIFVFDCNQERK